jgi:very-short-patch-repair endonuclease
VHWRVVDAALDSGAMVRMARGHFTLPTVDAGRAAAHRLSGAASHVTASLHHGWKAKTVGDEPHVTVRRKRSLRPGASDGVVVHWRDLDADDVVDGWVTSPVRTVIDCCLDLPFDEALAVVDSARRCGLRLRDIEPRAQWLGVRQHGRVMRVVAASSDRAANPFESVLRAIALDVRGLQLRPQVRLRYDDLDARVDLADDALRIVVEADSHEFHTRRRDFDRDCRRYNALVVHGWLVLRFTWEQVMFEPLTVRRALEAAVALRRAQGLWRRRTGQPAGSRRLHRWDQP